MNKFYAKLIVIIPLMLCTITALHSQTQQYLHFDRQNDFIEVPAASQYIAGAEGISMAGWFYCDALAYGQGMMSFRNGGTGDGEMYLIQLNDGVLECRLIINGTLYEVVSPAFTVLPEVWQHVAWIYDGNKVVLYIDGNVVGSAPASGTFASTDTPFSIGQHISPFNFYYGGRVDEVSLWSKGLSTEEISAMMENELEGDEQDLQLYYKFNQGVPGEDNQSISHLISETNSGVGNGDGILRNFALTGGTSNFLGDVDTRFQAISFPLIGNKLTSDDDFNLTASASSGLDVSYEVLSGPASVSGNVVSLMGTAGEVIIRATQVGNDDFDSAKEVDNSFMVIDPQENIAAVDIRSPMAGDVMLPSLGPIPLAAISTIDYPELFSVENLSFRVDGDAIFGKIGKNGHYTAWWTPPAYGSYTLEVISTNNFGAARTEMVTFEVVASSNDMSANAGEDVWLNVNVGQVDVEVELPSYIGAFDQIIGTLDIDCPDGGCDPWDRVSGVMVKGHTGEWYEIIRYITPYGIACNHEINLTDFMSLLHGKVTMRFYLGTQGNGFNYSLNLDYKAGTPDYPYSAVNKLWNATYPFGDFTNLQPVPLVNSNFPENTKASKIKLVSTGHGWGENNTDNASEFRESTHHILVNGETTFTQHNWNNCQPNPDGCNNQNGTWFHDRQGWCPGAIAPWFDFDMTSFVGSDIELYYRFDVTYRDFCHPNYALCVNGVTCANCDDGFNPNLIVSSYLINRGDEPIEANIFPVGLKNLEEQIAVDVFPNPSSGEINIVLNEGSRDLQVNVLNNVGQNLMTFDFDRMIEKTQIDLSTLNPGIYIIKVFTDQGSAIKKVILE